VRTRSAFSVFQYCFKIHFLCSILKFPAIIYNTCKKKYCVPTFGPLYMCVFMCTGARVFIYVGVCLCTNMASRPACQIFRKRNKWSTQHTENSPLKNILICFRSLSVLINCFLQEGHITKIKKINPKTLFSMSRDFLMFSTLLFPVIRRQRRHMKSSCGICVFVYTHSKL